MKNQKRAYVFLRTKHTTVCPAFSTKTSTWSDRQTDHSPISLQSSGDTSSVFWWQVVQPCFSFYHFPIIIIVCNGKWDDPIEKSRRVWEWWKANHSAPSIHYFAITAHLVALVQASSASVERVFSQVKLICDAMGVSI